LRKFTTHCQITLPAKPNNALCVTISTDYNALLQTTNYLTKFLSKISRKISQLVYRSFQPIEKPISTTKRSSPVSIRKKNNMCFVNSFRVFFDPIQNKHHFMDISFEFSSIPSKLNTISWTLGKLNWAKPPVAQRIDRSLKRNLASVVERKGSIFKSQSKIHHKSIALQHN